MCRLKTPVNAIQFLYRTWKIQGQCMESLKVYKTSRSPAKFPKHNWILKNFDAVHENLLSNAIRFKRFSLFTFARL